MSGTILKCLSEALNRSEVAAIGGFLQPGFASHFFFAFWGDGKASWRPSCVRVAAEAVVGSGGEVTADFESIMGKEVLWLWY